MLLKSDLSRAASFTFIACKFATFLAIKAHHPISYSFCLTMDSELFLSTRVRKVCFLQTGQTLSSQSGVGNGLFLARIFFNFRPPFSINLIFKPSLFVSWLVLVWSIFFKTPTGVGGTNITALWVPPLFHHLYLFFLSLLCLSRLNLLFCRGV